MRSLGMLQALEREVRDGRVQRASSGCTACACAPLRVVVAHHCETSYEALVSALGSAAEAWVYDKSDSGLRGAPAARAAVVRRVPNVGRESETYLRHIVEQYDDLAAHTLFVQDDVHVHIPPRHMRPFVEQVAEIRRHGLPGRMLQVAFRGRRREPPRRVDASGVGELRLYAELEAACERFGIELPGSYETHVCAFFLASRECIRRRPRAFYEALLAWHAEEASVARRRRAASAEQRAPWLLEHLWELIFFRGTGTERLQPQVDSQ